MIHHDVEQYSPEYWELHRGVPSASEFSRILTPTGKLSTQANAYALELLADSLGNGHEDGPVTRDMARGTYFEEAARKWYEFETGLTVRPGGFCTTDDKRFGCSPDGLCGGGGIELKCPKLSTHLSWLLAGGLPAEHWPQVHGCLIVTGLEWWDFLSYTEADLPNLRVRVVPSDYTAKLKAALEGFDVIYQRLREQVKSLRTGVS